MGSFLVNSYDQKVIDLDKQVSSEYSDINNCISTDETIKKITDKIALETKNNLVGIGDKMYTDALLRRKSSLESIFSENSCRDKIENVRLKTAGILITKGAVQQELTLLPKSNKEQQIYLTLGAVVLLVGLYIVSKK